MKRLFTTAVLLIVGAAATLAVVARLARPAPRRAAISLLRQAHAAEMTGDSRAQLQYLIGAVASDPNYLDALLELAHHPLTEVGTPSIKAHIDSAFALTTDVGLRACMRRFLALTRSQPTAGPIPPARATAADCYELYRLAASRPGPGRAPERVFRLWQKYPQSRTLALRLLDEAKADSTSDLGRRVSPRLIASPDPILRAIGFAMAVTTSRQPQPSDSLQRLGTRARTALAPLPLPARLTYEQSAGTPARIPLDSLFAFGDRFARLTYLRTRGKTAYEDGDLAVSERIWSYMIRAYEDLPALSGFAQLTRGRTFLKAGRLREAESDLLLARQRFEHINTPENLVQVEHALFHVYEALGDTARALQAAQAYVQRTQAPAFAGARMMAYHDLGWYYWQLRDYERARIVLLRMLAAIDTLNEFHHYAGEYYERIGDLTRALQMYARAERAQVNVDYRSLARRAGLAAMMGDSGEAMRLSRLHDAAINPGYPEFTPQLPTTLARLGRYQAALEAAEAAQARARDRKQAAAVASLLLQRARLELELGRALRGLPLADSAATQAHQLGAFETETLARGVRALASVIAHKRSEQTDSIIALTRSAGAARLPAIQLELYTLLGRAYAARDERGKALAAFERAALLNDSIAATLSSDVDQARFRGARHDVSARAFALIMQMRNDAAIAQVMRWSAQRKAHGLTTAPVAEVRPAADEAFIDFIALDTSLVVLVITRQQRALRVLPIGRNALAQQVSALRDQLAPRVGDMVDVTQSHFDAALAHALYRELLEPLMPYLAGIRRLVIVPDGPLHFLPFDMLVMAPTSRFVVRRFTIRYVPTLAAAGREPRAPHGLVLTLAGDAVNATAELAAISRSTTGRLRALTVNAATETSARNSSGAAIIHFVTHAAPNDIAPAFAYLALQSDAQHDGRLHAHEIGALRVLNTLVVLSGCDTSGGLLAGGEGVLSLSRAFLRAGATGTVATLWAVGPGTPQMMAQFYAGLSRGLTPSEALRQAKLQALAGGFASPLYWAPFVLISA